jgi:hypothetical protein
VVHEVAADSEANSRLNFSFPRLPEEGKNPLLFLCRQFLLSVGQEGWHRGAEPFGPNATRLLLQLAGVGMIAHDREAQRRLWEVSSQMVGLQP